jgi:hypothetical protein
MKNNPSYEPPPPAAPSDFRCFVTTAELEPDAARSSAVVPGGDAATVLSRLVAMGVNVSFRLSGSAGESPSRNDEAQPNDPQAIRRRQYEAYIGSSAWKNGEARMAELEASGHRCRICNRGREEVRLEVHHRTYLNFGCELMSDLTTLCAECHVVNTDMLRRRRYAVHVPIFADVPAAERGAPLFDPMAPGESS